MQRAASEPLGDESLKVGGPLDGKQQEFHINLHGSLVRNARQLSTCDLTKLDADPLAHFPGRRKHVTELLLEVHQRAFDPRVATIYLVQPCHLERKEKSIVY